MGNQISAGTLSFIINLTIVFAALVFLLGVILLIKGVFHKNLDAPAEKKTSVNPSSAEDAEVAAAEGLAKAEDIPVKIAAACAAVAANLEGVPHRVVSIRRLPPRSLWIQSARMENIKSDVMPRHRR